MDAETLTLLEFPHILSIIERFAHSPVGKSRIAAVSPLTDRVRIEEKLAQVRECMEYAQEEGRPVFRDLADPAALLADAASPGAILQPADLLLIAKIVRLGGDLKGNFPKEKWPLLRRELEALPTLDPLARQIDRAVDPSGEIREEADPELGSVRRRGARAREKVQEHLRGFFGSRAKFLIDQPYITLRNDRFVIPVRSEHARNIPGVVHGASSSGASLFVEPLSTVPFNNDCLRCQEQEREIVRRILAGLSDEIRAHLEECRQMVDVLAGLDALFACADFAERYGGVIPKVNNGDLLRIHKGRHPLLLENLGGDHVVAISAELSSGQNALVISGPNAGGKTVALKTIGLVSVMAQSGLPVCGVDAEVPVFHQVLADIGDRQSISQRLSTFSAHVLRMRQMMEQLDPPALILMDELGTGTDPVYGSALGVALIDFFRGRQAMIVATTHHQAIKAFAASTPGVANARVELDPTTFHPTYELQFGMTGDSSALEIARQLGLSEEIIARARSMLTEKDLQAERYLERLRSELEEGRQKKEELEAEKLALKDKEKQLQAEFESREEKRRRSLEKLIEEWGAEFRRESARLVKSIKDRFEAARTRKEMARKEALLKEEFRRRMSEKEVPQERTMDGSLTENDWVYHALFRKKGRIVQLRGDEATVEIEGKKVAANLRQIRKIENPSEPLARKLPSNVTVCRTRGDVSEELNVIGCTVEEAVTRIDQFLDQAFLAGLVEVRIIHGFGTGKLREAVSAFLQQHPHVDRHRVEGGVTVAVLNQ